MPPDQWPTYLLSGGGLATAAGLARWLYVLLVRGLATENARLAKRVTTLESEVETYRRRAFDAEDSRSRSSTTTGGSA